MDGMQTISPSSQHYLLPETKCLFAIEFQKLIVSLFVAKSPEKVSAKPDSDKLHFKMI